MGLNLDTNPPDRQAELAAWVARHRVKHESLADILGVHPSYIGKIFSGERRPRKHIERLVAAGVPRDLLPEPHDARPGPKPRPASVHEEFEAAYKG